MKNLSALFWFIIAFWSFLGGVFGFLAFWTSESNFIPEIIRRIGAVLILIITLMLCSISALLGVKNLE